MALWMEPGGQPLTPEEQADLDALAALKESAAIELKEKGNEYVKMGKKHYIDAVDCYTRAINQKTMDALNTSILYANRAHVHLLLGNHRHALLDSQEAIKLNPENVKGYFRGAKAALALELLPDASEFCTFGLEQDPTNTELKKLKLEVDRKFAKMKEHEREATVVKARAEALVTAFSNRNVRVGKALYKEHTAGRKPWLDTSNVLHWPVLLLYGEVMASDFIEDFCETESFSTHLDILFGKDAPLLQWDTNHEYTRSKIEVYYKASAGHALRKKKVMNYLLEDITGLKGLEFDDDDEDGGTLPYNSGEESSPQWVKVQERSTLFDVLTKEDYIVPGLPVFYVVSVSSFFYHNFLSGQWAPP